MPSDTEIRTWVASKIADKLRQFARNGRWGTCNECPKNIKGHALPEKCEFTTRYDHKFCIEEIVSIFNREVKRLGGG